MGDNISTDKYEELAAKLEQTQAQVRRLQRTQKIYDPRVRVSTNNPRNVNVYMPGHSGSFGSLPAPSGPSLPLGTQYVTRSEFENIAHAMTSQYRWSVYTLKNLQFECEKQNKSVAEKQLRDSEELERLEEEVQQLQAQVRVTNERLAAVQRQVACRKSGRPNHVDVLRRELSRQPSATAEEKEKTRALFEGMLLYLDKEMHKIDDEIDCFVYGIRDVVTDTVIHLHDKVPHEYKENDLVYSAYKRHLRWLFNKVNSFLRTWKNVYPEDEDEVDDEDADDDADKSADEDEDEQLADEGERSVRGAEDEDYDCTEGDDSMVL